MLRFFPDYYKDFKCIADKCRHNCCIGWEIDIDEDTFDYYKSIGGRFLDCIDENPTPHFILGEDERCPFLNSQNLCEIITEHGDEHLCEICREHPRFHNYLPDRVESGLGLVCEEAARLIVTKKEPVAFEAFGDCKSEFDEIIALRDEIISFLQDRSLPLESRFENAFELTSEKPSLPSLDSFIKLLKGLERLDEKWTELLNLFSDNFPEKKDNGFKNCIESRLTEYEQLSVYLIYRHFSKSEDISDCVAYLKFSALVTQFIYLLGQSIFEKTGKFSLEAQLEIMRLFSGEIEYSDENMEIILGFLGV